jgi:hypothetical protein
MSSERRNEVEDLADAKADEVVRQGYQALGESIPRTWRIGRGISFSMGDHISVEHVRGASGDAYRVEVDIAWDLERPDHIFVAIEVLEDAPKRRVRCAQRLLLVAPDDHVRPA